MSHDGQRGPDSGPATLRDQKVSRTESARSVRGVYNDKIAAIVEGVLLGLDASGDHRASNAAIATALGVSDTRVGQIRSQRCWTMGDVLAMDAHGATRHAARVIVAEVAASMSPAPARLSLDRATATIGAAFGKFCGDMIDALADGVIDGAEPAALKVALRGITSECEAVIREIDVRSAPLAKATPREQAVKLGVAGRAAGGAR